MKIKTFFEKMSLGFLLLMLLRIVNANVVVIHKSSLSPMTFMNHKYREGTGANYVALQFRNLELLSKIKYDYELYKNAKIIYSSRQLDYKFCSGERTIEDITFYNFSPKSEIHLVGNINIVSDSPVLTDIKFGSINKQYFGNSSFHEKFTADGKAYSYSSHAKVYANKCWSASPSFGSGYELSRQFTIFVVPPKQKNATKVTDHVVTKKKIILSSSINIQKK